jgi:hypothetical protein
MKTISTTILWLFFLVTGPIVNAQLLKKIAQSDEKATERAVLKKTEQKTAEKTDQTLDGIFNLDLGGMMGDSNMDPSILPESYNYEWRYTLQTEHKKGNMKMHYYLREEGSDFASRMEMQQQSMMGGMLMLIDPALNVTSILMNSKGKKHGQIISTPEMDLSNTDFENSMDGYEFKEIGTKEIIGYRCQGFQIENEDTIMTMYVAFDTPVSLNKVYGNDPKRLPKGFDPKWLDKIGKNSLMMEMDFHNKKKPKQSAKMRCVALEKDPLTINIAEYEFPQLREQRQ